MQTKRNTKQKEYILKNLQNRFDHPTVKDFYNDSKKENIKIGTTTIYRILKDLSNEEKKVVKIQTKDNVSHYDFNQNNHIHLICESCKKIIDISIEKVFKDEKIFCEFKINPQNIVLYGICQNCKNKKQP